MNLSEIFIKRPIMTILVMAALLLSGIASYFSLPVNELPNVDFPTIVVQASIPGMDAGTMGSAVATPLETQFSQVPGLDSMNSVSVLGTTQITLTFRLDRNIDGAALDVQSALSAATRPGCRIGHCGTRRRLWHGWLTVAPVRAAMRPAAGEFRRCR